MSESLPEIAVGDVCPKRFGLNYDPPSIVLEYLQLSTGKLFHRRIGLKRLRKTSDPSRVAEKLRQRNKALLEEDKVSFEQIVTLVTKLQESMDNDGDQKPERKRSQSLDKSKEPIQGAPECGLGQPAAKSKASSGAADVADAPSSAASLSTSPVGNAPARGPGGGYGSAEAPPASQVASVKEDDLVEPEDGNLNKLSTEELDRHKAQMDVTFFQNQKKPGDPGYEYDVQVDFPETENPSGWDSDDSV